MTRIISRMICLTMALVLGAAGWCSAQAPAVPLGDRVPGDAMIYIGWTGSSMLGPEYADSHLKAILDASQIPQVFSEMVPQLVTKLGKADDQAGGIAQMVLEIGAPMWKHPCAIYFGGIDLAAGPSPKLALLCDAGDDAAALLAEVQKAAANIPPGSVPVTAKRYDSLVVVATMPEAATDALFAKAPDLALNKSAGFTAAVGQVQNNPVMVLYVDIPAIVKQTDDVIQLMNDPQATGIWTKAQATLNLPGLKQAIWTSGFDGKDWSDQAFIGTDGTTTGLPGMMEAPPFSEELLAKAPQTADRVLAAQLNLAALYHAIHDGMEQVDPDIAGTIDQTVTQINQSVGIDVVKDLLEPLGNQWMLYSDRQVAGPGLLGTVAINHLKDAAKVDASLQHLQEKAGEMIEESMSDSGMKISFRPSTVDGVTLHYLPVPLVQPTWAIKDGDLYMGLYPQVVSSAVRFSDSKGPSILQNANYLAVQKHLGDHKPSSVIYTDLPAAALEGYTELLAGAQLYLGLADMAGATEPAMVLPPLDRIMPQLSASGAITWNDSAGMHSRSITPFPGAELLSNGGLVLTSVAQEGLMISILLPSLNRARETANRVKCASDERQIGQGILLYANDHQGQYPPDLGTLVETENLAPEVFICPSGTSTVTPDVAAMTPAQKAEWVDEHSDYIYVGKGLTATTAKGDQIIVYEKPGAHGGDGMNFLYGDGHVEFQNATQAQQLIQQSGKPTGGGL